MLVLIVLLLAAIPAVAVLYPFLRNRNSIEVPEDESSTHAYLLRRWDAALSGLKTTELERAIGNLTEEDYRGLREQQMTEAALVMQAMELEETEEEALLSALASEVQQVRSRVLGPDAAEPSKCADCKSPLDTDGALCAKCVSSQPQPPMDSEPSKGAFGE